MWATSVCVAPKGMVFLPFWPLKRLLIVAILVLIK